MKYGGGVPAHFIKKRFDDERINLLKQNDIYNQTWDQVKDCTWSKLKKE